MKILTIWAGLIALAGCEEMMASNENDPCGASALQYLVGSDATDIDAVEGLPKNLRVIMPNMPVTMDFSETRLNIYIDPKNRVAKVRCG